MGVALASAYKRRLAFLRFEAYVRDGSSTLEKEADKGEWGGGIYGYEGRDFISIKN